jgi:Raf kinase inhibitor-like YbhB/YbcL family protein
MTLSSPAFTAGGEIPQEFSHNSGDRSPALAWTDSPKGVRSFALVMHDPDAPGQGGFLHWILFNIPAHTNKLPENIPHTEVVDGVGVQGKNDLGKLGYVGPAPPSGTHRYFLRLTALDRELELPAGTSLQDLRAAMQGYELAEAELMGSFSAQKRGAA